MEGYYSISRELDETLDLLTGNDVKLYVHCVRRAAFRVSPLCPKGSLLDTLPGLSQRTGLTVQEIRTSLKNLEKSGLLGKSQHDTQQAKRGNFIDVKHYVDPAQANTISNRQLTGSQQAANRQPTWLEDVKKEERKNDVYARDAGAFGALDGPRPLPPPAYQDPEIHPNVTAVKRVFTARTPTATATTTSTRPASQQVGGNESPPYTGPGSYYPPPPKNAEPSPELWDEGAAFFAELKKKFKKPLQAVVSLKESSPLLHGAKCACEKCFPAIIAEGKRNNA